MKCKICLSLSIVDFSYSTRVSSSKNTHSITVIYSTKSVKLVNAKSNGGLGLAAQGWEAIELALIKLESAAGK